MIISKVVFSQFISYCYIYKNFIMILNLYHI